MTTEQDKAIADWNEKTELFNKCVRTCLSESAYEQCNEEIYLFGVSLDGFSSSLHFNTDDDCERPWSLKVECEDSQTSFKSHDITDLLFNKMLIEDKDYPEDSWERVGQFLDLNPWVADDTGLRSVSLHSVGMNMNCGHIETIDEFISLRQKDKPIGMSINPRNKI